MGISKVIALLWGGFLMLLPSVVGRVMIALGVGYVSYVGFGVAIDTLYSQIKSNFSGMPVEVINFLGYCWVDKAIGMMFSAFVAAHLIKLAGKTAITKMVVGAPSA